MDSHELQREVEWQVAPRDVSVLTPDPLRSHLWARRIGRTRTTALPWQRQQSGVYRQAMRRDEAEKAALKALVDCAKTAIRGNRGAERGEAKSLPTAA